MNEVITKPTSTKYTNACPFRATPLTCDVCIIGAGVAGSALAWYLGNQGINVVVIERDFSEPDKFIGELLQPGGVIKLQEMGYTGVLEGFDAQSINGYALFNEERNFSIPYPEVKGTIATGRGFRYGKFISSLREQLRHLPTVNLIQGSANMLLDNKNSGVVTGVQFQTKESNEAVINAHLTVVCDGGFSRFRSDLNRGEQQTKGFMVGLLLKNCELPYPGHGHVFMSGKSPFLAYPVSSTETRLLVDFPGNTSPKQGGKVQTYLHDITTKMPESMRPSFLEAIQDAKIKAMPSMTVAAEPINKSGVIMLGDALNMRHPLTGGGMTAALTDVQLLGSLLFGVERFENNTSIKKVGEMFYRSRHHSNATINILADALYDVMTYPDLKQACYDYLSRGDKYAKGPVSILSGISRNKKLLVQEFFAVALFGANCILKPFPTPRSLIRSYNLFKEAIHIIKPRLLNEHPSLSMRMALQLSGVIFPRVQSANSDIWPKQAK